MLLATFGNVVIFYFSSDNVLGYKKFHVLHNVLYRSYCSLGVAHSEFYLVYLFYISATSVFIVLSKLTFLSPPKEELTFLVCHLELDKEETGENSDKLIAQDDRSLHESY